MVENKLTSEKVDSELSKLTPQEAENLIEKVRGTTSVKRRDFRGKVSLDGQMKNGLFRITKSWRPWADISGIGGSWEKPARVKRPLRNPRRPPPRQLTGTQIRRGCGCGKTTVQTQSNKKVKLL